MVDRRTFIIVGGGPGPVEGDGLDAGFFGQRLLRAHGRPVSHPARRARPGRAVMHGDLETLRDHTDQVGDAVHTLGHRYAGIAAVPEERRRTLDDYRRMADELNAIGTRAQGLGFKVEMDVFWTVAGGADPVELLDAYPRLYRLMHVKDMSRQVRFANGGTMQDLMALFPAMVPAGSGVLDLPRILGHARKNGVEHSYVEQDLAADPPTQLGTAFKKLRAMVLVG